MTTNEQMITTTIIIYFISGVGIAILHHYLKQILFKEWHFNGIPLIPAHSHLCDSMDSLIKAPKLKRWFAKLDVSVIDVRSITITDINWFSAKPDPKKLGFVKFNINALDKSTQKQIASNVVFLRGDSVAVLIVVNVVMSGKQNKEYVLLCDQMRVASGGRRIEICAGMMDDDGNIASVVLKEVKEETGFDIKNKRELKELGSIFPSPGACDEEVFLYSWTITITEKEFEEKQRNVFGNSKEGEEIRLLFVEMNKMQHVLVNVKDVKAECAYRRYQCNK
jgi:ADP-sugar diphosphatase